MTTEITTYRVQFSGLSEARAHVACESMAGSVHSIRTWTTGTEVWAEFIVDADDAEQATASMNDDDRVVSYIAR